MRICRIGFLRCLMASAFVMFIFNGISYADLTVSINGVSTSPTPSPLPSSMPAPSGPFRITATVSVTGTSVLSKVVFYRNDVPYKTVTGSALYIDENGLGTDTYTYRARAYDTENNFADSNEIKLTVHTPRVFRMGDVINDSLTHFQTSGPDRFEDHTDDIEEAIAYLVRQGGGTLYFPCSGGPVSTAYPDGDLQSIYNIKRTIEVPSNVILQGESAEEGIFNGRCRIYWNDDIGTNNSAERCRRRLLGFVLQRSDHRRIRQRVGRSPLRHEQHAPDGRRRQLEKYKFRQ
mgnify:CR=1 FL=1|jgi:hypothetical protein